MATRNSLTAERLRELLTYDQDTGLFRWRTSRRGQGRKIGEIAGTPFGQQGYVRISIDWVIYLAHRLAWLYMTGVFPPQEVDHKDEDKGNNRFLNLRLATPKQNHENVAIYRSNTSGFRGVHFEKSRNKWRADIKHNGVSIRIGRFHSFDEAKSARIEAERGLFTHASANCSTHSRNAFPQE